MLLALTSWKGSPGVSTAALALALTWPAHRAVLVAECDPLGGQVLAGYGAGAPTGRRGVLDMALVARTAATDLPDALAAHRVALGGSGRRWLLPGVRHPEEAAAVPWDRVAALLARHPHNDTPADTANGDSAAAGAPAQAADDKQDVDVLADCGRLRSVDYPTPVLAAADLRVLLLTGSLTGVYALHRSARLLRDQLGPAGPAAGPGGLVAVVVAAGVGGYDSGEIRRHLDPVEIPVIGTLPYDPAAAAVLSDGVAPRRGFTRSPLLRAATHLATRLEQQGLEHQHPTTPPAALRETARRETGPTVPR